MSRRTGGTNAWNSFSESKKSGSYPPRNSSNDAFAPATMKFPDNSNFWANFLCRSPNKTMAACSAQKNGCLLCVFMNSFSLFGDFICIFSSVLQTECVCRLFFYSVDVQYLLTVADLRRCSCVDLWYCLCIYSTLSFKCLGEVFFSFFLKEINTFIQHGCFKCIKSQYKDNYIVTHFNISILNKWNFIKKTWKMYHGSQLSFAFASKE